MSTEMGICAVLWIIWAIIVMVGLSPKQVTEEDEYGVSYATGYTPGATKMEKTEAGVIFFSLLIFHIFFFDEINRIFMVFLNGGLGFIGEVFLGGGPGLFFFIAIPLGLLSAFLFCTFSLFFLVPLIVVGIGTALNCAVSYVKKII